VGYKASRPPLKCYRPDARSPLKRPLGRGRRVRGIHSTRTRSGLECEAQKPLAIVEKTEERSKGWLERRLCALFPAGPQLTDRFVAECARFTVKSF